MTLLIYVQLLVIFIESVMSQSDCPLYNLTNGRVRFHSRGSSATSHCNDGFQLHGYSHSTCQSGRWNWKAEPICVRNGCKPIPKQPNLLVDPMKEGAVLNFWCRNGFVLNGTKMTGCDGKEWQHRIPECLPSDTKPQLACDFEREDICGWTREATDDFDWRRSNNMSMSRDGYFMLSDAYLMQVKARLLSPLFAKTSTETCFQFWYHLYDAPSKDTLRVYLRKSNPTVGTLNSSRVIFELSAADQSNQWLKHRSYLGAIDQDYQIVFEAIHGSIPWSASEIAFDDVEIIENCQQETTTIKYNTTTTNATPTERISAQPSTTTTTITAPEIVPEADKPDKTISSSLPTNKGKKPINGRISKLMVAFQIEMHILDGNMSFAEDYKLLN